VVGATDSAKIQLLERASSAVHSVTHTPELKDETLDLLASQANVAQFVSFGPDLKQRYCRLFGVEANFVFSSPVAAITRLFEASGEGKVNIRTFKPGLSKSSDFITNLTAVDDVFSKLRQFSSRELFTIVNEGIDVNDGGVSGVVFAGIVEFSPGATPRVVEGGDFASLPVEIALDVFERVYKFKPRLDWGFQNRVEFSLHPTKRGVRRDNTIVWEIKTMQIEPLSRRIRWPNGFSRHLGDKLFGLVLADSLGFAVPKTLAIPRWLPPFTFGRNTNSLSGGIWIRTCPATKTPGKFSTIRGWTDPFVLMQSEDPSGDLLSSVIVQDEVDPVYSGGVLSTQAGPPVIEGVSGTGNALMLGLQGPGELPGSIRTDVERLFENVNAIVGPVRIEWVHDGKNAWIVQLQQEWTAADEDIIVPAQNPNIQYVQFRTEDGLDKLRALVSEVAKTGLGIVLNGNVGLTSHMAEVLNEAKIPSKRVRSTEGQSPKVFN
jgi:hypothetical protein